MALEAASGELMLDFPKPKVHLSPGHPPVRSISGSPHRLRGCLLHVGVFILGFIWGSYLGGMLGRLGLAATGKVACKLGP